MKKFLTTIIAIFQILLFAQIALAEPDTSVMMESLPEELSSINHFGTEFLFSVPPCISDENTSGTDIVKVYITSFTRTFVTITGKYNFLETRELRPYQTSEIDIPAYVAQPYLKSSYEPAMPNLVFPAAAVKISSDEPVAVYVVVRFSKASDAFLAFPTNSLGKTYVISSFNDASADYPGFYSLPSMTSIVAAYDNTIAKFILGGNSQTSLGNIKTADTITKYMKKGDLWLISSMGSNADLSGSVVESNFPIAVISGNQCANIPSGNSYCDYIVEMETPIKAWGNTFHVPIIKGRKKSPIIRIYASLPNTDVYLDGKKIASIAKAGGLIGIGYLEYRINADSAATAGVISSNKPIALSLYNTGIQEDSYPEPLGDPFLMSLVPMEQYQNEILFTTRGISNKDSEYYESYISIAYKKDIFGGIPRELQIGAYNGKKFVWSQISDISPIIHKDFVKNSQGETWATFTFPFSSDGVYKIRSNEPISAYYYGLAFNEGIGFPLAMGLQEVSSPDKEKPRVSYKMSCTGDATGTTIDFPEDASIRSNLAYPIFYSDSSYNYDREFGYMIPGDTRQIEWKLKVRDKDIPARAVLLFRDFAGNDSLITVEYKPLEIDILPEFTDFGSIKSGKSMTKEFRLINRSKQSITITKFDLASLNTKFEILEPKPFKTIDPGETVYFFVRFNAAEFGEFTDSIALGDGCQYHFKARLFAKVGNPDIFANDVAFYDVNISKPIEKQFAVQNKGKSDLTITSFSGTFTAAFKFAPASEISEANPLVIPPNAYHSFSVWFDPNAEGFARDSIVFHSDANVSDSITYLSGRGIQPKLAVQSYDWGKRRISTLSKPIEPYFVANATNSLSIENIGSAVLTIKSVEIIGDDISKNAFIFDLSQLIGQSISPNNKIQFTPKYLPHSIGSNLIELSIVDDNNYSMKFVLSGTGIAPQYHSNLTDFGTTLIGDLNNYSVRTIAIQNLSLNENPFGDTLTINSLSFTPDNSISINNGFGSEGFRIILKNINFPLILAPDESVSIFVYFSATKVGVNKAFLNLSSDALSESSFTLIGNGVGDELSISSPITEVCLNEKAVIPIEFTNNSYSPIEIGSLRFANPNSLFAFANQADQLGFDILPRDSRTIPIEYTAKSSAIASDVLLLIGRQSGQVFDSVAIFAQTKLVERFTIINPIQQTAQIGQTANIRLILSDGQDISFAKVSEIDVFVSFDSDMLIPRIATVSIGKSLENDFVIANLKNNSSGLVSFTFKSINDSYIEDFGELAKIDFDVLLPNQNIDYSLITANLVIKNTSCVRFLQSQAKINLKQVCAIDIRKIQSSGVKYQLGDVVPNPSANSDLIIPFAIGIDAATQINIYSADGQLATEALSDILKAGEYEITIPISELSSGAYYYRIISGPFSETKKFVIAK